MAEDRRMTSEEVVRDLLSREHADVVRESVRWSRAVMEVEVSELTGPNGRSRSADTALSVMRRRASAVWKDRMGRDLWLKAYRVEREEEPSDGPSRPGVG